jgi:hypothetical protein
MDIPFSHKPLPAICLAVGLGIAASEANANAARVLGMPALLFSALLALTIAALGFGG